MKAKSWKMAASAFALAAAFTVFTAQGAQELCSACAQALANFKCSDSSLQNVLANSAGYAVFPGVGKGGFIIGGAHGKGCLYENGMVTGQAKLSQATIGAQIGGQSFAELIVFQTPDALNNFKGGNYGLNANASAVVITEGAVASSRYNACCVSVFTMPKAGLMGELSVGGQRLSYQPACDGTVAMNCCHDQAPNPCAR